ncbi:hypothetical protein KXV85_003509, partial [Aspergillus fumigatus]
RQHPVPRAAAVARQVRRSPASFPRNHGQRLQSAADLARHRAPALRGNRRSAIDRAELSVDRGGPPRRRRRDPHHAKADETAGAAAIQPERISPRPVRRRRRCLACESRRRHRYNHLSSRRHREDGACERSLRRGRRAAALLRHRRLAHCRRLGDAHHHLGQHQHADRDDRGKGRGDDLGRLAT